MTYKFGFELEGFYCPVAGSGEVAGIPPKNYPTDGFPGLVEFRSKGGQSIEKAYADILIEAMKYPNVMCWQSSAIFTPKRRAELRRRYENKTMYDIQNLYGKYPRPLGNKTIASLQINISMVNCEEYTNKDGVQFPTRYGLLDIPRIVRALDEEFSAEIKESKRQPGEYCVKDGFRLEYRSLPNKVFGFDTVKAAALCKRIESAVKGEV